MGTAGSDAGPDLEAVDELCRLALVARRLGCHIHLVDAGPDLRAVIDLAGVGEVLADCPCPGPATGSSPDLAPGPATESSPDHAPGSGVL